MALLFEWCCEDCFFPGSTGAPVAGVKSRKLRMGRFKMYYNDESGERGDLPQVFPLTLHPPMPPKAAIHEWQYVLSASVHVHLWSHDHHLRFHKDRAQAWPEGGEDELQLRKGLVPGTQRGGDWAIRQLNLDFLLEKS